MLTLVMLFLCILFIAIIYAFKIAMRPYHIYSLVIRNDYLSTWHAFSDPLRYKELYPNWIKNIEHIVADRYQVQDQFGNEYPIQVSVSQEFGIINLQIGNESSELRLFKLDPSSTLVLHLAKRWQGITAMRWISHKKIVAKDFCHAKLVLERYK